MLAPVDIPHVVDCFVVKILVHDRVSVDSVEEVSKWIRVVRGREYLISNM